MTGVVGLAVYSYMLWRVMTNARRVWRDQQNSPEARGLAIGVASATVAVVMHSVFVNSLLTTYVVEILWVLWAAIAILAKRIPVSRSVDLPRVVALRVSGG
jgi:hypothetical protein